MRVVVTGGRAYANAEIVFGSLDTEHNENGIELLITGACPYGGADLLAENWAKENEVPYMGIPAKFKTIGRKAGPLRNAEMLDLVKPHLVVGFPGGAGTANCIKEATKRDIEVRTYE